MAEKPKTPNADARRRKRTAPTIDLTATEVAAAPAAAEAPPPEPPVPPEPSASFSEPPPEPDRPPQAIAKNPWLSGPTLAAGVAGATLVTLVLFGLWLTGMVPIRYAGSTAMRARVAGLEMQMHDLQKRPAAAADTGAIDALNERLNKIEAAIGKIPANDPATVERIAAIDNTLRSLGVALSALGKRSDDAVTNAGQARERAEAAEKAVTDLRASLKDVAKDASAAVAPAELDVLQKRLATLEQSSKTVRDDLAKTAATDSAARLALSAAALRSAAVNGAPFAAELAQVKSFGGDAKVLAPLEPFAAGGVPTQAALAQELRLLLPGMVKLAGTPAPAGGFLDRLQANAGKLVRIRPVDAVTGDDASAVLARLEIAAAHADIAGALTDLALLPAATRAPAQGWIAKAQARQAALTAARAFAVDTARALGPR